MKQEMKQQGCPGIYSWVERLGLHKWIEAFTYQSKNKERRR